MTGLSSRHLWLIGGVLAAVVLSACENPGLSGRDDEFRRLQSAGEFAVVEQSPTRTVFIVRKNRVVIEPPKGYCLDEESVAVTPSVAFVLIAECLGSQDAALAQKVSAGNVVEIELPRAFPGILTISISGRRAYGPQADALDDFEGLLGSEAGSKLLSRGGNAAPGKIIATRRIGGSLYVLIEEKTAHGAPILAERFWRAFIDVNERLVLVTVSSFSDRPIAEDAMLGFLAQQMVVLRRVNGQPIDLEENEIADNMVAALGLAGEKISVTVVGANRVVAASAGPDPSGAPIPPQRLASANIAFATPMPRRAPRSLPGSAPNKSPVAPARP